jgi:hypothetical protein
MIMKPVLSYLLFFLFSGFCEAQNCEVVIPALKGTYEGGCKKNKADGKGTATGEDTYTGEFKNGYPEGQGKYNWKNGDWYEGQWKKGWREGKGTMYYKNKNSKDSLLTGFWKKDKYIGLYEKPYIVYSKTPDISSLDIQRENSQNREITFLMQSTRGGATAISGPMPKIIITDINVVNGLYITRTDDYNMPKTNKTILRGVDFPLRLRVSFAGSGSESDLLEIEFLEAGRYTVDIRVNK